VRLSDAILAATNVLAGAMAGALLIALAVDLA